MLSFSRLGSGTRLHPKDEGTRIFRNVGKYLIVDIP